MNAFKELAFSVQQVKKNLLTNQEQQIDSLFEEKKLEALYEIKSYVLEMDWITQKRTKERIQFYLKNQCSISKTAEHYKTQHNTIQVGMSTLNWTIFIRTCS